MRWVLGSASLRFHFRSTVDLKMARFTTKIAGVVVVEVRVTRAFRWRFSAVVVLSVEGRFLILIPLGRTSIVAKFLVKTV